MSDERTSDEKRNPADPAVPRTGAEARQGREGRPVNMILIASLAIGAVALAIVWLAFV